MKSIAILYAANNENRQFEKYFDGKSAFERSLEWASSIDSALSIVIFTIPSLEEKVMTFVDSYNKSEGVKKTVNVITKDFWTNLILLQQMALLCEQNCCDCAVYAWASCPFLDSALTKDVIDSHEKYLAEYTYADGYPYGFAPEVIAGGALNILSSLATSVRSQEGAESVCEHSIFNVMKADLNSFEIETVIAPKDFRSYRLYFSSRTKLETLSCIKLYEEAKKQNVPLKADDLTLLAIHSADVQMTVPAFYNVQIASMVNSQHKYSPYVNVFSKKYGFSPVGLEDYSQCMKIEEFNALLYQISEFSDEAVVSLSAWGEPLLLPNLCEYIKAALKYDGISLLIETDGFKVTPQLACQIADIVSDSAPRRNKKNAITWIVLLDSCTKEMHGKMFGTNEEGLEKSPFDRARDAVITLENYFPGDVYPQFLRVKENECQLETFYRYYHDENSPSKGKLIIQKYDSYCGFMADEKPADLSPLERNVCWHLKRDMTVLSDGSVPLCKEMLLDGSMGNVFNEGIESVWNKIRVKTCEQLKGCIGEKCRACDEYYTFNF